MPALSVLINIFDQLIKTIRLTASRDRIQNLQHKFLCGDKQMTTSTDNQNADYTGNTDQWDTIMHAAEAALYYPSLKDEPWDDELLPSGD